MLLVILFGLILLVPLRGDDQSPDEKKAIAGSQHEMLMLLIEKGEYEQVPEELRIILELKFEGKYEKYVTDEIVILSTQLSQKQQYELCHQILDMGLAALQEKESLARLYKEKGAVYKLTGDSEKALEMFKKSVELTARQKDE
ncbi:MAG: hypothetical protein JXQ27_02875 [Acidobacteria bacterium]|nr:hypothetical protein [Acidobacteriota bacterium]